MTVGQWLVAGIVALVVVGAVLVLQTWWRDNHKNGDGAS